MASTIPAEVREALVAPLGRLASLDPFELLTLGPVVNDELLRGQAEIAAMRRAAVRTLRADGWTLREIADRIGVEPQRVHQISLGR